MKCAKALAAVSITFILLTSCCVAPQPSNDKNNTENIKLIGHTDESNSIASEIAVARGLAISGNYAYVAIPKCTLDTDDGRYMCNEDWLRVIDISDPTSPTEIAIHLMPNFTIAVVASDEYIYVVDEWRNLRILDLSDPRSPTEVAVRRILSQLDYVDSIALVEHYAYISGSKCIKANDYIEGVWILDVSDPMDPGESGFYAIAGDAIHCVLLAGEHALVAQVYYNGGFTASRRFVGSLQHIDRTKPIVALTEISSLNLQTYPDAAVASDGYFYIAYGRKGLQIIDVSDSANPTEIGFYNAPEGIWHIVADEAGDYYLYVADAKGALSVLQFTPNQD